MGTHFDCGWWGDYAEVPMSRPVRRYDRVIHDNRYNRQHPRPFPAKAWRLRDVFFPAPDLNAKLVGVDHINCSVDSGDWAECEEGSNSKWRHSATSSFLSGNLCYVCNIKCVDW